MTRTKQLLLAATLALAATSGTQAHDDDGRYRPVPQIDGVWQTKVSIRDCQTRNVIAGPFAGLLTFAAGGTVSESAPALPATARGPSHGLWRRIGRTTFAQAMVFQRFDLSGILLGSQVIRATAQVANDGLTFTAEGTFEVKDTQGNTLARGCSSGVAARFE